MSHKHFGVTFLLLQSANVAHYTSVSPNFHPFTVLRGAQGSACQYQCKAVCALQVTLV